MGLAFVLLILIALAVALIGGGSLLLLTGHYFWCLVKRRKRAPASYYLAVGLLWIAAALFCGIKASKELQADWGFYASGFVLLAFFTLTYGAVATIASGIYKNRKLLRRRTGSLLRSAAQFIDTPADNQP